MIKIDYSTTCYRTTGPKYPCKQHTSALNTSWKEFRQLAMIENNLLLFAVENFELTYLPLLLT